MLIVVYVGVFLQGMYIHGSSILGLVCDKVHEAFGMMFGSF